MKSKIRYGTVDITRPHFLINYTPDPGGDPSSRRPIAILSSAQSITDLRLELLTCNVDDMPVLEMIHQKINFYLFELKNKDNVEYLKYYCTTLSNLAYSHIIFNYIKKIHKNNIFYYLITRSKQMGIYNNPSVTNMQQRYVEITVERLFGEVLDHDILCNTVDYNKDLYDIYDLIFFLKVPLADNFKITDAFTIVEFSKWLDKLDNSAYCNILNYLIKIRLLKKADVDRFLKLFIENKRQYQGISTSS